MKKKRSLINIYCLIILGFGILLTITFMGLSADTDLRILFVGNSITNRNDVPSLVKEMAEDDSVTCFTRMKAYDGWSLEDHIEDNIKRSIVGEDYDYVVLQDFAHPFDSKRFYESLEVLVPVIKNAGAKCVLYLPWAMEDDEEGQKRLNMVYKAARIKFGVLLAPVGENWFEYIEENNADFFQDDREHATLSGATYAADIIWDTIKEDYDLVLKEREAGAE